MFKGSGPSKGGKADKDAKAEKKVFGGKAEKKTEKKAAKKFGPFEIREESKPEQGKPSQKEKEPQKKFVRVKKECQVTQDKNFKLPSSANALCAQFDEHNGDFDTPEEFVRAYLSHDRRALEALDVQNMELLRDAMEKMYPEIRELMREETTTAENMKKYLNELSRKMEEPSPT